MQTTSFTSALKVYETCPRQYQFFRDFDFTPSRSAEIFFGALVHQTIEDIHRLVLDKRAHELNEGKIRKMFNFNFRHLLGFYKQLCIYAHILERRYDRKAERLLLYWTGEPMREDALMEFPYSPAIVDKAGIYFDQVVAQILNKDYAMHKAPEHKVCKECDLRIYCGREGTITLAKEEI
ncbi:MAG: PD-(D/E)XK nuclease family protein [Syntrophales bacterium]|nr:PD-(D/E)XK nuclease family protein [Syntrophales bacterium]